MLVVYSFAQCATLQPSVKAPFTITEATYQNWVGERPEVYGANLSICIEALNEGPYNRCIIRMQSIHQA